MFQSNVPDNFAKTSRFIKPNQDVCHFMIFTVLPGRFKHPCNVSVEGKSFQCSFEFGSLGVLAKMSTPDTPFFDKINFY